jgi:hypothetical protein
MDKSDVLKDDRVHEILHMIPSTKYQYEGGSEKVLLVEQPFSYQQFNTPVHPITKSNYHAGCYYTDCKDASFNLSTPELTDSSASNSPRFPTPVQLVDPPIVEAVFTDKPAKRNTTLHKTKSIRTKKVTRSKSFFEKIKDLFSFQS